jgi:hypothetical protein
MERPETDRVSDGESDGSTRAVTDTPRHGGAGLVHRFDEGFRTGIQTAGDRGNPFGQLLGVSSRRICVREFEATRMKV